MADLKVQIREIDKPELIPARVHLLDDKGNAYYPDKCVAYKNDNHFTVDGQFNISLPNGKFSILIEKGKEYRPVSGELVIQKNADHHIDCELARWINMAERGWYSGDLHIHRPIDNMAHLIKAEDLNVAPDITVWNERNFWANKEIPENKVIEVDETHVYGIMTQEDERGGGAVMIMNMESPIDLGATSRWYPANFAYCNVAHERSLIVDQEKPFWWEAPVNVALGGVDTIGIINNHIQRDGIMDNEAWGKPRDKNLYPGNRGFVDNVLDLYYRYLNLGLRLPISAGSASGVLKNPVGYNRLYVHLGRRFSYERWLRGMNAGMAFATNGPMLFFSIDHCELGSVLDVDEKYVGKTSLEVVSQDKLDKAEIIYNGEIIKEFSGGNKSELKQELEIPLDKSGWIVARAFEKNSRTVRFAHTNPIYIRVGGVSMEPSKEAAQYYLNWCKELLAASSSDKDRYATEEQREEVESLYRRAIEFYERKN